MKYKIRFIDKLDKSFERSFIIDFKDDLEPYQWAEKQLTEWLKCDKDKKRKLKYNISEVKETMKKCGHIILVERKQIHHR